MTTVLPKSGQCSKFTQGLGQTGTQPPNSSTIDDVLHFHLTYSLPVVFPLNETIDSDIFQYR